MATGSKAWTRAPRCSSSSIKFTLGASRMSSVPGLKASPHTANCRPLKSSPKRATTRRPKRPRCRSLMAWVACSMLSSVPASVAMWARARTSLGKHDPPQPQPAYKKWLPMRESLPMPSRTCSISAPTFSASSAISFIKLMRVASMALATYLVSSALRTSIIISRSRLRRNGAYKARINSAAWSLSQPTTTRSGRIKSSIATPSLRNSGLETTAKGSTAAR